MTHNKRLVILSVVIISGAYCISNIFLPMSKQLVFAARQITNNLSPIAKKFQLLTLPYA